MSAGATIIVDHLWRRKVEVWVAKKLLKWGLRGRKRESEKNYKKDEIDCSERCFQGEFLMKQINRKWRSSILKSD